MTLHLASEQEKLRLCKLLNTSEQQLDENVHRVREWLKQQHHLPQCTSDTMIASFLIGCNNSVETTKQRLENYYTMRSQMPHYYSDRDPLDKRIQLCSEALRLFILPKLTPDGCRVTMSSFRIGDPNRYDVKAYTKRLLAVADIRYNNEVFYTGDYLVLDGSSYTLSHVLKLTPSFAKDVIYCTQDVLPLHIRGIICINSPSFMERTINIVKPFLKSKIFNRIHIYSQDHTALLNHFPQEMLPKDYGGQEDTSDNLNDAWRRRLENEREWLLNEGSTTVDESKRPKQSKSDSEQLFGIQGSFTKLDID